MIRKEEFDKILRGFVKETDARVYIFGSRARGDNSPCSDVDIGVLIASGERAGIKISLLREKFENSNIPQKVDVVDLSKVSDDFREKIMKEAILWKKD
ncbi:MAG: nucleotidyltransferase domain-containing protein [Elusimicrobia bacterium]|nr:nucleotidyltransferase domain-containing protein [Elusimicrobiota bacterium]